MTRGEILKDFFKKTVLPVVIAWFLFSMFKNVFTEDGQTNYFYVWLFCGITGFRPRCRNNQGSGCRRTYRG